MPDPTTTLTNEAEARVRRFVEGEPFTRIYDADHPNPTVPFRADLRALLAELARGRGDTERLARAEATLRAITEAGPEQDPGEGEWGLSCGDAYECGMDAGRFDCAEMARGYFAVTPATHEVR